LAFAVAVAVAVAFDFAVAGRLYEPAQEREERGFTKNLTQCGRACLSGMPKKSAP
jgi:hypothetical protein